MMNSWNYSDYSTAVERNVAQGIERLGFTLVFRFIKIFT